MKRLLLFSDDQLWIRHTPEGPSCLFDADPAAFALTEPLPAYAAEEVFAAESAGPPAPGTERVTLRALFDLVTPQRYAQAGLARQLLHWRRAHRFCGACGAPLQRHASERAMVCPACGHTAYPRINPVVITLVARGDQILLTRKAGGVLPFWSLVAGFVEANETLEQAVAREIAEEVGLRVTDIRYAASQPWPYPNNLMFGFTAAYESGSITPDGVEIAEAGWFGRDDLPPIPSRVSIARRLIDAFFAQA
ncbi:MAG: NAD(+) diphosphatase [Kiritimatiellae bacterium]|nr:NAD(+) diphosphatase [Kiritimatiellia bacterium]